MSKTWQQIRQELSRRVNEPIMRRVGTEVSVGGSTSTINFYSAALAHLTNQWGVQYGTAYVSSTTDGLAPLGQELEIQNFLTDGSIGYAYVQPTGFYPALAAGDKVEIHEFFTAQQLLDATNQAIRDAWPAFYRMTRDETIMFRKFKREYDLTALAVKPRHIVGAYVEPIFRVGIGTATSALAGSSTVTASTFPDDLIIVPAANFTPAQGGRYLFVTSAGSFYSPSYTLNGANYEFSVYPSPSSIGPTAEIYTMPHSINANPALAGFVDVSNWDGSNIILTPGLNFALEDNKVYECAVYYGSGAGSFANVAEGDSGENGLVLDSNLSAIPDGTTEFMVKNMSDVYYNWLGPLAKTRYDQDESPNLVEILYDTYELWGARMRLEYASPLAELTTETSTLPDDVAGYVIPRAMYYLYLQNIGRSAQFDVKTAATLADQYQKEADQFRDRNRMKRLGGTIRTDAQYMNWSDREMPFKR